VESVVYALLFKNKNSTLNKLLVLLLQIEHEGKIQTLTNSFQQKKSFDLTHEDILAKKYQAFLLEQKDSPYHKVIKKIESLKDYEDPYSKFEIILSLEDEILKSAKEFYEDDKNIKAKLEENWNIEVKLPILVYCILKSENQDVIKDSLLIKEFVIERYWNEKIQNFKIFEVSIDLAKG